MIPVLTPGSSNVLAWEGMKSLSDGVVIEDATVTADIKDTNGVALDNGSGMALTHQASGNYYGYMPTNVPLVEDEYYYVEYTATRPSGQVGKTTVLTRAHNGAAPIPTTDEITRLERLSSNILKAIETVTGFEGCPTPSYEIEGFKMDWMAVRAQLWEEYNACRDQLAGRSLFEISTQAGTPRPWPG